MTVKIRKGNILNVVPLEAFNNTYKQYGWEIVGENTESEINKEIKDKGIVTENQQNAFIKAKHESKKRSFDDKLFKGD